MTVEDGSPVMLERQFDHGLLSNMKWMFLAISQLSLASHPPLDGLAVTLVPMKPIEQVLSFLLGVQQSGPVPVDLT